MELLTGGLMQRDRSYYRMCTDAQLIDEALYHPNVELAVVLGERLAAVADELEANDVEWNRHLDAMEEKLSDLTARVEELEDELDRSEA